MSVIVGKIHFIQMKSNLFGPPDTNGGGGNGDQDLKVTLMGPPDTDGGGNDGGDAVPFK